MTSPYLNSPLRSEAEVRKEAHKALGDQLADSCFENGAIAMKVLAAELLIERGHRDAARMVLTITLDAAKRRSILERAGK